MPKSVALFAENYVGRRAYNLEHWQEWLALGIGVAVASWLLVYAIRYAALHFGVLDKPNHRSSHTGLTPRGGGLVVVVACMACWGVGWALFGGHSDWHDSAAFGIAVLGSGTLGIGILGIGSLGIAAVGAIDDVRSVSAKLRLGVQVLAAVVTISLCDMSEVATIPLVGDVHLGWSLKIVAFIWIVGLTNAYNFMDGIDGIAGSQAVVAGLGWFILGEIAGRPGVGGVGLLLAVSSIGFLPHNWPPAKIFMGDVGSTFLGYSFAYLPLAAASTTPRAWVAGALLVWPFIFDTTFTFLRRLREGEPVLEAHRSHFYQQLVIAGWTHQSVTLLYAGLSVIGLVLGVLFVAVPGLGDWLVVTITPLCAAGLWLLVRSQRAAVPAARASTEVRP